MKLILSEKTVIAILHRYIEDRYNVTPVHCSFEYSSDYFITFLLPDELEGADSTNEESEKE